MCNKWVIAEKQTFRVSLISKTAISEALPDFNTAQLIQAEEANYITITEMRSTALHIKQTERCF